MTTNADAFNAALDAWREQDMPQAVHDFQVKIGFEALKRIVNRTPVDTGRARGNWQVSAGAPIETELDVTDKAGGDTRSAGLAALQKADAYATTYISNNLPYIVVLEQGEYPNPPKQGSPIRARDLPRRGAGKVRRALKLSGIRFIVKSAGGFSRQAPLGMVGVTVSELTDFAVTERV